MRADSRFLPDMDDLAAAPNKGRTILFETVYGSKLYGCDMPGSDHDIRGVYLPGLYDFLREVAPEVEPLTPDADLGESDDIAYFPAGRFVDQLIRMKTNCVEIFFAALQARKEGACFHPAMEMLLDRKGDLISADYGGFIGHARQRAAKYIDGDDTQDLTLQANKHVLDVLKEAAARSLEAPALRICDIDGLADALSDHPGVMRTTAKSGDPTVRVNSRNLVETTRLAEAITVTDQRLDRYRRKALDVEPRVMFKDLCTSLRMMETVADLMETGEIVFPRPRAEHFRAIRRGEVDRLAILEDIDAAQERAVAALENGTTPLRPAYLEGEHAPVRTEIVAHLRWLAIKEISL